MIHTWIGAVVEDKHIGLYHGLDGSHVAFLTDRLPFVLSRVGCLGERGKKKIGETEDVDEAHAQCVMRAGVKR